MSQKHKEEKKTLQKAQEGKGVRPLYGTIKVSVGLGDKW